MRAFSHIGTSSRTARVRLFVLRAAGALRVRRRARAFSFFLAFAASLFIFMPSASMGSHAEGISEQGASQIGDNTVKAIDHDLDRYDRTTTLFSSPENGILPEAPGSETVQRVRRNLENHTYWGVHYIPKNRRKGDGALAVFIDSRTGAILGIYTEK